MNDIKKKIAAILMEAMTPQQAADVFRKHGIDPATDPETLKRAFRGLVMKFHPDRNPGNPNAQATTQEINIAYDTLKSSPAQPQPQAQAYQSGPTAPPPPRYTGPTLNPARVTDPEEDTAWSRAFMARVKTPLSKAPRSIRK